MALMPIEQLENELEQYFPELLHSVDSDSDDDRAGEAPLETVHFDNGVSVITKFHLGLNDPYTVCFPEFRDGQTHQVVVTNTRIFSKYDYHLVIRTRDDQRIIVAVGSSWHDDESKKRSAAHLLNALRDPAALFAEKHQLVFQGADTLSIIEGDPKILIRRRNVGGACEQCASCQEYKACDRPIAYTPLHEVFEEGSGYTICIDLIKRVQKKDVFGTVIVSVIYELRLYHKDHVDHPIRYDLAHQREENAHHGTFQDALAKLTQLAEQAADSLHTDVVATNFYKNRIFKDYSFTPSITLAPRMSIDDYRALDLSQVQTQFYVMWVQTPTECGRRVDTDELYVFDRERGCVYHHETSYRDIICVSDIKNCLENIADMSNKQPYREMVYRELKLVPNADYLQYYLDNSFPNDVRISEEITLAPHMTEAQFRQPDAYQCQDSNNETRFRFMLVDGKRLHIYDCDEDYIFDEGDISADPYRRLQLSISSPPELSENDDSQQLEYQLYKLLGYAPNEDLGISITADSLMQYFAFGEYHDTASPRTRDIILKNGFTIAPQMTQAQFRKSGAYQFQHADDTNRYRLMWIRDPVSAVGSYAIYDRELDYIFQWVGSISEKQLKKSFEEDLSLTFQKRQSRILWHTYAIQPNATLSPFQDKLTFDIFKHHFLGIPEYRGDNTQYRLEWASYVLGGFILDPLINALKLPLEVAPSLVTELFWHIWNQPQPEHPEPSSRVARGVALAVLAPFALIAYGVKFISRAVLTPIKSLQDASKWQHPVTKAVACTMSAVIGAAAVVAAVVFAPLLVPKMGAATAAKIVAPRQGSFLSRIHGFFASVWQSLSASKGVSAAIGVAATARAVPPLQRIATQATVASDSAKASADDPVVTKSETLNGGDASPAQGDSVSSADRNGVVVESAGAQPGQTVDAGGPDVPLPGDAAAALTEIVASSRLLHNKHFQARYLEVPSDCPIKEKDDSVFDCGQLFHPTQPTNAPAASKACLKNDAVQPGDPAQKNKKTVDFNKTNQVLLFQRTDHDDDVGWERGRHNRRGYGY